MDKNIRIFASCHNHSYFSDGDYSPEMMVKLAYNMGHGGFILTDHDTVKGTYFAHKEAKRWGLKTVLGCEFSTFHKGVGVHLLGFDFNPDNKRMREHLALGSSTQTDRSKLLFEWGLERGTLREGCSWDDVIRAYPYNDYICNNQIFEVMKKKRIYEHHEYNDFFMTNFSQSLGYEEKISSITGKSFRHFDTQSMVETILEAGGVPIVAHPHDRREFVSDFLDMGVMGFETRHPELTDGEFMYYEALCEEKGLYKMGGSDHWGVLGANIEHGDQYSCPYEKSGILEQDFMKLYERRLG